MKKSIFDLTNEHYKTGKYPLFCSNPVTLVDGISSPYPSIMAFYEKQMAMSWKWTEVNLSQDRLDMMNANKEYVDLMVDTLLYQWSLDSIASNAILPLFAPFISAPEVNLLFTEVTRMEAIHAMTYSHIVQQTLPHPKEALHKAMTLKESVTRGSKIIEIFDEMAHVGGLIRCGELAADSNRARKTVLRGMVNLYILEQMSFMSSFAVTFAISELGIFQGIGRLVSLIARDELHVHAAADADIVSMLIEAWPELYAEVKDELVALVDEAKQIELDWNKYLFTGRSCVGLTQSLLDDWVHYMSMPIYETLGAEPPVVISENPLPYMDFYLDVNSTQVAAQESDLISYQMDSVEDDLDGEPLQF